MKHALVTGAGGLVGGYLVKKLLENGYRVRSAGRRNPATWHQTHLQAENICLDLREKENCDRAVRGVDEVYNLATVVGGAQFLETHKADCMLAVLINANLLRAAAEAGVGRYFFASTHGVTEFERSLHEGKVPKENPYILEKLFSERLSRHFSIDFGLPVCIARLVNVYGAYDVYDGGKERVPAAFCRKAIHAKRSGAHEIEVWGDGNQVRSFLYGDDAAEGIMRVMASDIIDPVTVGSNEYVTMNELLDVVEKHAGVRFKRLYNPAGPTGVEVKPAASLLIDTRLDWRPKINLDEGMGRLYRWIEKEIQKNKIDI